MPAPKVTVRILEGVLEQNRDVVFDFDRLAFLEEATGHNINGICAEIAACVPKGKSDVDKQAAGDRFSIRFVRKFIAGCLGVGPEQVNGLVPLSSLQDCFTQLVEGFFQAVGQMGGKETTPPADPLTPPTA